VAFCGRKWEKVDRKMISFIGQSQSKLDAKNRIKIPKVILKQILSASSSKKLHITLGLEKCLFLFTEEAWREREQRMENIPLNSRAARKFERLFFGNAREVEPDSLARFIIPDHLLHRIGDAKELVFVGVKNRIEIWAAEEWRKVNDDDEKDYESLAEDILI